ncbi:MAG TPA: proton-conducting transporter membrane subunit [Chthoniobacterales bacterium]|nr:proton-conducting transporter membrane subunit [Chthoniobacterales bacterium]
MIQNLAPLPIVLPLCVTAFLACTSKILPRIVADLLAILTAAAVTVLMCLLLHAAAAGTIVYWLGGWTPRHGIAIGIALTIDPIGAGLAAFVAFLVMTALIFAWRYFDSVGTLFQTLMLTFLAAMVGFCLSGDIFTLFVFFELMSVSAFALTAHKIEASSIEGALNFAITNSIAAFSLLWGIALLYGRTGALNLAQLGRALAGKPVDGLVVMAFALIICGFLIKAAMAPFHFWLADAHAVAPTPVCVLFSGVMVELGVYGIFRIYWTVFEPAMRPHAAQLRLLFLSLGAATALLGAFMCFWQRHFKRMLAFSTISHVGMILAGVGTLTAHGLAGAGLYVLGHGMVKASLFMCAGIFLQCFGSLDEEALRGSGREVKWLGLIVGIAAIGLTGFPPFGTYLGKALMEESADRFGQDWLAWIFLIASAVTGAAVLRVAGGVFLGWGSTSEAAAPTEPETRETNEGSKRLPAVMVTMAALLALLPAFSGFVPPLASAAQAASERFIDSAGYGRTVLEGYSLGKTQATEKAEPTIKGMTYAFVAALAAVVIAALALSADRLPRVLRRPLGRPGGWIRSGLRTIHSGDPRDYVAWLSLGLCGMAAALAFIWRS